MKSIKNYIDESLIKSYDSDILLKKIRLKYEDKINDIHIHKSKSNIQSFSIQFNERYVDDIAYDQSLYKLLDFFGYYITEFNYVEEESNYILRFEPIFGQKCNNLVYDECDGVVFHITNREHIKSIQSKGLIPISNSSYRNFSERTFYSCGKNKEEIFSNLNHLISQLKNGKDYIILRIDLKKHNYNVDFYFDPSEDDVHNYIYANACIFPHMIEEIGKIEDLDKYYQIKESYKDIEIFGRKIKMHTCKPEDRYKCNNIL